MNTFRSSHGYRHRRIRVLPIIVTAILLCLVPFSISDDDAVKGECHLDSNEKIGGDNILGSCANLNAQPKEADDYYCGMYLAESSIPNSGWGLFAGAQGYQEGDTFPPDAAILVTEIPEESILQSGFKLWDYIWDPYAACCNFEAHWRSHSSLVLPSLGSMANSHTRLFNADPLAASVNRVSLLRTNASAGAFSQCINHQFRATHPIAPGHEIFTKYGDFWFVTRFPDVPRLTDYEAIDDLLHRWIQLVVLLHRHMDDDDGDDDYFYYDGSDFGSLEEKLSSEWAAHTWQKLVSTFMGKKNERIQAIMPQTHAEVIAAALHPDGLAGTTSTHFRSLEWLQQNGMCVDYLQMRPSKHVPYQNGAFVKRPFQKGERVAPFPVTPTSREHVKIKKRGEHQHNYAQQLLLNYCYGHPESSLLLYPYGHVVNLINHAPSGGNRTTTARATSSFANKHANVALRWSPLNNNSHWQQSVLDILAEPKTTILFELYALRDLEAGEEVLLDYGPSFEMAWQRHVHDWHVSPPIHSENYQPPKDYAIPREHGGGTTDDNSGSNKFAPSYMQARCAIDLQAAKRIGVDAEGFFPFQLEWWDPDLQMMDNDIHWTTPCEILSGSSVAPGLNQTYRVVAFDYDDHDVLKEKVRIKDVPWNAIAFVDKPYQGHQFLRQAFRHEIHLSDELFPEAWKDLPKVPPKCNLFMAESTIPNSTGLGVFTAQPIAAGNRINVGDVAVPVVDYLQHNRLRRNYLIMKNETSERSWLLDSHYHQVLELSLEANDVQSMIPGLSMLASVRHHPGGVVNSALVEPTQMTTLHRGHDAGAGGSSYYHDAYSIATKSLQAGEELFFESTGIDEDAQTAPTETQPRVRTVEWLEANGRCLDNLRPDDSTILQAGKGAFATRRISQGTVIAPMPVVPILRHDLEIFESVENEFGTMQIRHLGKQLFINYCYGHPSSSLLLFPYSPVVNYLNHSPSPNAKLQWSTLFGQKMEWLQRSPAELAGDPNAGIAMELIALRDIQPDEEVFLDYGDEWAKKWQEFEVTWKPDDKNYVPAWMLNKRMEWIRTEEELVTDPYPYANVFTACFVGRGPQLVTDFVKPPVYKWIYYDGIYEDTKFLFPCDVLERDIGNATLTEVIDRRESVIPLEVHYKVRVHRMEEGNVSIYISVPREAIRFFDREYTSDIFLRNAFRHEIHLPDEMVPKGWRDHEDIQTNSE